MKTIATITGPTCSGKDHFLRHLIANGHPKLVSTTTRPKRPGEVEGQDYCFISEQEHDALLEAEAFTQTVTFSGYRYGVTIDEVENKFKTHDIAFVIVEPGGVYQYERVCNEYGYDLFTIFVDTNEKVLNDRIRERTVASLLNPNLTEDQIRGFLRRYEDVVTGKESMWIAVHPYNLFINGQGTPETNYLAFLNAYNARQQETTA